MSCSPGFCVAFSSASLGRSSVDSLTAISSVADTAGLPCRRGGQAICDQRRSLSISPATQTAAPIAAPATISAISRVPSRSRIHLNAARLSHAPANAAEEAGADSASCHAPTIDPAGARHKPPSVYPASDFGSVLSGTAGQLRAVDERAQLPERDVAREVLHPAVRADQPLRRDARCSAASMRRATTSGVSTRRRRRGRARRRSPSCRRSARASPGRAAAGRPRSPGRRRRSPRARPGTGSRRAVVDDVGVAEAGVQRGRPRRRPRARGRWRGARTRAPSRRVTAATARRSGRRRRRPRTGRGAPR